MDLEKTSETTAPTPANLARQRSSRRLRHEAQAKVFERQTGSLDELRLRLGLRPSQICELLKVHPSAWTRWTRAGRAPPHVFQMLEWYVELLQWRGQYRSPKEATTLLQAVNKENPSIYVPETDSLQSTSVSNQRILPTAPFPRVTKVLIAVWVLQAALWGIALRMLILRKF